MRPFHWFRHLIVTILIVILIVNWFSLRSEVKTLKLDQSRLIAVTNAVLAIQDYYFLEDSFPASLADLKSKGYLSSDALLEDPETTEPFYYLSRGEDFVFCTWLSTGVKGVNPQSCPAPESQAATKIATSPQEVKTGIGMVEVTGESGVNVRNAPSLDAEVIAGVNKGRIFPFNEIQDNWYKISIEPGFEGWVFGDFVTVKP